MHKYWRRNLFCFVCRKQSLKSWCSTMYLVLVWIYTVYPLEHRPMCTNHFVKSWPLSNIQFKSTTALLLTDWWIFFFFFLYWNFDFVLFPFHFPTILKKVKTFPSVGYWEWSLWTIQNVVLIWPRDLHIHCSACSGACIVLCSMRYNSAPYYFRIRFLG